MRKAEIALILLVLATSGCGQPVNVDVDAAAIRQLTDVEWLEAGREKDIDQWMSYYTDDTIFFPPDGPLVKGKEAMRELVSSLLANPGYESTWETTTVEVSRSGDMAYSFGPQQTTLNDEQGNSVTQRQKWSIVWKKQADGAWKCAFMTLDSDNNAATAPQE